MGGYCTFILFICIIHFLTVNGEHVTRRNASHHQHQHHHHHHHHQHHHDHLNHRHLHHHQQNSHRVQPGFESPRLELIYPVIQIFKRILLYDPNGNTKTWQGKNICRDYKGFVCDIVPGYNVKSLSGVDFNNCNFDGPNLTIIDILTGLPDIVSFHAHSNNFTGSIPIEFKNFKYLSELDLSDNYFSGNFPYELVHASKLKILDLRFNIFSGAIPHQVFLLKLECLLLNNNHFTQKLPDNLGSTPVHYLSLANNKLVGGIPPSIGQANNTLIEVLFLNNHLTGCLPYQIGLLGKAKVFDVELNDLTGPVPHSFQCLKNMESLTLAQNKFYGVLPEAVCGLPKLFYFNLSYNYFTQVGPQCRELIMNGVVDMKMNCIPDLPDQRTSTDCATYFSRTHSCPNETSLTYVPCSEGYAHDDQLKSVGIQFTTLVSRTVSVQAPRAGIYGALSRDYFVNSRLYKKNHKKRHVNYQN